MTGSRWLVGLIVATSALALTSGCSSSSSSPSTPLDGADGGDAGDGSRRTDCSDSPPDLCVLLTLADLNGACKASFSVPLTHTEPFGNGSAQIGFVGRQCRYDNVPANAAEPWMKVERSCYGGGASDVQQRFDASRQDATETSEPRRTETAPGIGDDAFYVFATDTVSETQRLVSRQGNVGFEATIDNAVGSREAVKACLAGVLRKVMAAAPSK